MSPEKSSKCASTLIESESRTVGFLPMLTAAASRRERRPLRLPKSRAPRKRRDTAADFSTANWRSGIPVSRPSRRRARRGRQSPILAPKMSRRARNLPPRANPESPRWRFARPIPARARAAKSSLARRGGKRFCAANRHRRRGFCRSESSLRPRPRAPPQKPSRRNPPPSPKPSGAKNATQTPPPNRHSKKKQVSPAKN